MDEAERCTNVGYIYQSNLIAQGTPAELKKVPEVTPQGTHRFEIDALEITRIHGALRTWEHTRDSTIFGATVHALVDDKVDEGSIQKFLLSKGLTVHNIRPIQPTLEDVFVTMTHFEDEKLLKKGGA